MSISLQSRHIAIFTNSRSYFRDQLFGLANAHSWIICWKQPASKTRFERLRYTLYKPRWRKGKRATAVRVWRPLAKKSTLIDATNRHSTADKWLPIDG